MILLFALLGFLCAASTIAAECPNPKVVTLESLLEEMCDPDAATRLADPAWKGRLWSSHDRASVSPNEEMTWFANNDYSRFVATNRIAGRVENVLVDAKGPGVLTRLWTANGYGTVYRFYVDGATEPVITGVGTNLIGGHVLCEAPFADQLSASQPQTHRAQDLYLPIPFAKSLIVTAELKDIPPDDDGEKAIRLWYNAEVRTYDANTVVESFSSNVLARARPALGKAAAILKALPLPTTDAEKSLDGVLKAHESRTVSFSREGAIRAFSLKLTGPDEPLRNVRVKMSFDGETTVDVSVGQLFAAGYAARPFATVDGEVRCDGWMTLREVMPFARSCSVTLTNTGDADCTVDASAIAVGAYRWNPARSLHFGAFGFEERNLPTRRGKAKYFELNWVKLEGRGYLVGNTLATDNSWSERWWGEGDEKIYLDGESFPSYFGTGTEDFFGYSWGCDTAFTGHPFLALPCSEKPPIEGRRLTTCKRVRRLDRIPFSTSLRLDVEVWHWDDCKMHYAPATFWYARPGVKVSREADRKASSCEKKVQIEISTDHTNAMYRCGETCAFSVSVTGDAALMKTGEVSVVLDNFGPTALAKRSQALSEAKTLVVGGTRSDPGFLRLTVNVGGERKIWGAGYEPERIRAVTSVPDDFDSFWLKARQKIAREVPLDARMTKVDERCTEKFDFYRISFATYGRRIHGYMSVPTDRSKAPFAVELQISAAGFGGWSNDMTPSADHIRVFFGVYPFEPDWKWREKGLVSAYDALNAAADRKYACGRYCNAGSGVSREEYFYYPVILGIDRAVDWIAARPEVDAKRMRYQGTSQGGGLGLALTALNKHISRAVFFVPAITDTLAGDAGRRSGWPQPMENLKREESRSVARGVMPYFDGASFATRITCPVRFAVGLADETCPPHCTYAAFNAVKSKDKDLIYGIGMGHGSFGHFYEALMRWLNDEQT